MSELKKWADGRKKILIIKRSAKRK